jgi:hypothetical protein
MKCSDLDDFLPPPTVCSMTIHTSYGEKSIDELGELMIPEEWTEISRLTHEVEIADEANPEFSVTVERIDEITFESGTSQLKLIFTGWGDDPA